MSLCGLRRPPPLRPRREAKQDKGKGKEEPVLVDECGDAGLITVDEDTYIYDSERNEQLQTRKSSPNFDYDYDWEREDQLSTILENLEDGGSQRDGSSDCHPTPTPPPPVTPTTPETEPRKARGFRPRTKRTRFGEHLSSPANISKQSRAAAKMSSTMSGRRTPETPRPIAAPPRDLESIAYIDKSLVFEHFTTNDAWELGSALRNRLLPIPTPVVINIALANQNQVLFHTCTHPGVMPDNDNWVTRKRKTVLRWGCSTWYMHCKFEGDEFAFRDRYGLGNSAGEYAIHGGGVPIRVTGVEGVVAVVVVSGLKQHEDHGVIVEVIRELYY
ncbi:hypothetical protein LZ554_000968 [Drepanopeziza brunnea f. sp. 'monogermtubi']|nr:hypothetical protein LZ554_000968 [Drepanopeziza brunnea f. sp. 'monogermtubi']